MASGGKGQKSANLTFGSAVSSTVVEETLFGRAEDEEEEEVDDGPVVFICGKCKLPVGDSTSWDGSEACQKQIRLKRVTDFVMMGADTHMHEISKRCVCLVVDLICRGCNSVLGMVYASTPKNLDHKRFAFCFNVSDIDSYVLGSAKQMLAAEGPREQPATLEYRGRVEQQLTEMKMLVMTMAQKLEEIDSGLPEDSSVARP